MRFACLDLKALIQVGELIQVENDEAHCSSRFFGRHAVLGLKFVHELQQVSDILFPGWHGQA